MSESNPFDDLAEEGPSDERASESTRESDTEMDASQSAESRNTTESRTETSSATTRSAVRTADSGGDGPTLSNSSPPFPYSETEQQQMYVQSGFWDDFEDLKFDAELELRRTFDVRNVEQREIDTALIRLVLEQLEPRTIAEEIIQMRGFEVSDPE